MDVPTSSNPHIDIDIQRVALLFHYVERHERPDKAALYSAEFVKLLLVYPYKNLNRIELVI